jgi:hypothetical protein
MNSMTEPHADRPQEPILTEDKSYAPKRVRWPGLLAVAVLVAAAIGGVVVTNQEDAKRTNGSPDRGAQAPTQAPPAEPPSAQQRDDTKVAQPARPAQPSQP